MHAGQYLTLGAQPDDSQFRPRLLQHVVRPLLARLLRRGPPGSLVETRLAPHPFASPIALAPLDRTRAGHEKSWV